MGNDDFTYLLAPEALSNHVSPRNGEEERSRGLEQVMLLLLDYLDLEHRPGRRRALDRAIESVDLLLHRSRRPCPFGIFELPMSRVVAGRVPAEEVGQGEPGLGPAGLFWQRYRFPLKVQFSLFEPERVQLHELEFQGVLLNSTLSRDDPELVGLKEASGSECVTGASLSPSLSSVGDSVGDGEERWRVDLGPHEFSLRWCDPGSSPRLEVMVDLAVSPEAVAGEGPLLLFLQGRVKVSGARHDGWSAANVIGISLDDSRRDPSCAVTCGAARSAKSS